MFLYGYKSTYEALEEHATTWKLAPGHCVFLIWGLCIFIWKLYFSFGRCVVLIWELCISHFTKSTCVCLYNYRHTENIFSFLIVARLVYHVLTWVIYFVENARTLVKLIFCYCPCQQFNIGIYALKGSAVTFPCPLNFSPYRHGIEFQTIYSYGNDVSMTTCALISLIPSFTTPIIFVSLRGNAGSN